MKRCLSNIFKFKKRLFFSSDWQKSRLKISDVNTMGNLFPHILLKAVQTGSSLAAHWLGLCAFTARALSCPGWETKIPKAARSGQEKKKKINSGKVRTLVVQGLRIHLPIQGTQVWPQVWEDPTCLRATKPTSHTTKARAPEPVLRNKRSHHSEKPVQGSLKGGVSAHRSWRKIAWSNEQPMHSKVSLFKKCKS